METVGDLAFLGYCFASLQGARWRFPLDQDGEPAFTFVDEVDRGTERLEDRPPHGGMGPDADRRPGVVLERGHQLREGRTPLPGGVLPEGTPTNTKEVTSAG